jgi:hypothetical protein
MSKGTIGQFDFAVTSFDGKTSLPFDPWVEIALKRWGRKVDGAPSLSPRLMTEAEIDEHVAALKADLDAVGSRAKRALHLAQDRTLKLVRQRGGESNES